MKRLILTIALSISALVSNAMPYSEARRHALFLTDKMAYELNLTEHQFDDAYQINLDYFLSVATPNDIYGPHYRFRNRDLRYILMDWQYALYAAADYFVQPLLWRANSWFLPILHRYDHAHYYFSRPRVYDHYHGGGHFNYVTRRPGAWRGGMMGHEPHGGARPDYNYRHPGSDRPHNPGFMQPGHNDRPHNPSMGGGNTRPDHNNGTRPDMGGGNRHGGNTKPQARPVVPTRSTGNGAGRGGNGGGSHSRNGGRGGR